MKSNKPTTFYKNVFLKTSTEQQAAFLEQLFSKDADLRAQFKDFTAAWATANTSIKQPILSFVDLEKYRQKVHDKLSDMHFDMESVYKYFDQGDRSYVPGHEAAWEGAENMLRKKGFKPFFKEATVFLDKGNLIDGVKVVLAVYEGHNDVFEPGYDEEDAFQDYNDVCLDIFKEKMFPLLQQIEKVATQSEEAVIMLFDLIFERMQHWNSQYKDSLVKGDWEDYNIVYDLKVLEPLFLALLTTDKVAIHLEKLLLKDNLTDRETSKIFLKIAKLKGSQKD